MENVIFLDTSFIISFFNADDEQHNDSQSVIKKTLEKNPNMKFCYSDYIFDELITLMKSRRIKISQIMQVGDSILKSKIWTRLKITEILFEKTWIKAKLYTDKPWSFTDISSFVIMDEYKIKNYLSYNSHFEQNPNISKWRV